MVIFSFFLKSVRKWKSSIIWFFGSKDRKQSFKTIQEQTKTVLKEEKTKQIQTSQPIKKAKQSSEQEIDQHIDRKRESREQSNDNDWGLSM